MESPRIPFHNCVVDKTACPACASIYERVYKERIARLSKIGCEVSGFDPYLSYYRRPETSLHTMSKRSWDMFDTILKLLLKYMTPQEIEERIKQNIEQTDQFVNEKKTEAGQYNDGRRLKFKLTRK